jgi:hypothetical protein
VPDPNQLVDDEEQKLKQHPAYQLGLQHGAAAAAIAEGGGGLATTTPVGASPLPRPRPVTGLDSLATATPAGDTLKAGYNQVVSPVVTPSNPSGAGTPPPNPVDVGEANALNAKAEQISRTGPVDKYGRPLTAIQSKADYDARRGGPGDPFSNGFFRSGIPRVASAGPTPPVGGTQAVAIDPSTSLKGNTRVPAANTILAETAPETARRIIGRYSDGKTVPVTTSAPVLPATRRPVISGAIGTNQAADYVAGGKFSSAKDGQDPTLDETYIANQPVPRRRRQYAVAPRASRLFYQR